MPGETVSAGFDNIADVQNLSPTLLEAYLTGAAEIVRLALGDADAVASEATYKVPRYASQREHVEGAPFGTRGGISFEHNFIADGEYVFRMSFVVDLMSPHKWNLADKKIGYSYGNTALPHLRDLMIGGPYGETSVSETETRARILTCQLEGDGSQFAESIVRRLAAQALRRPVNQMDVDGLMGLYHQGATEGGFEGGIRTALQGILASPDFVFRFEEPAPDVSEGRICRTCDLDVASRLSFLLRNTPPEPRAGDSPKTLDARSRDMESREDQLRADPHSEVMGTCFA